MQHKEWYEATPFSGYDIGISAVGVSAALILAAVSVRRLYQQPQEPTAMPIQIPSTTSELQSIFEMKKWISLSLGALLFPVGLYFFTRGFFPLKTLLPCCANTTSTSIAPYYDRLVFMVVDGLRHDFVFGHSHMPYLEQYLPASLEGFACLY
jgi:hypothetical protein